MKINEIILEKYETSDSMDDTPLELSPYQRTRGEDMDLMQHVRELIKSGTVPEEVTLDTSEMLATQDFLDLTKSINKGPIFPKYDDKPVVLQNDEGNHILDGHHRSAKAYDAGETVDVYMFKSEKENFE